MKPLVLCFWKDCFERFDFMFKRKQRVDLYASIHTDFFLKVPFKRGDSFRNKGGASFLINWCFSSAAHNAVRLWILYLPTTAKGSNRICSFICIWFFVLSFCNARCLKLKKWRELFNFTAVANLCVRLTVMVEVSDTKSVAGYQLGIKLGGKKPKKQGGKL